LRVSNHCHVVLHVDPDAAQAFSDEEVARRWLKAFPGRLKHDADPKSRERAILAIVGVPDRVTELRKRLGSLSWFMKALNEPIARQANREESCKGKFWEGRFKCQALLDEQAVLSCMAYVDLNPVRAGMHSSLIESDHTTIQKRLKANQGLLDKLTGRFQEDRSLKPVAGLDTETLLGMTESSYIALVQWTGQQARWGKRGKLKPLVEREEPFPASTLLVIENKKQWLRQVQGTESCYYRAIGSAEALMAKAEELKQSWMKGVSSELARKILRERPT
jgi:hypothetical protein